MHPIISRTFGGLSPQYYFRQLVFALMFPAMALFLFSRAPNVHTVPLGFIALVVVNTLLYPYARFVYESVVDFILGRNIFIVNIAVMFFARVATMIICWALALVIAPIGLTYLYFRTSRGSI